MKGLLGQAWTKPAQQHVSRSVGLLIARLNQCSYWVASVVLSPSTLSKRVKTLTKVIRIGDALRKMHNFMGVAYIIFGLSQASVSRLKFTLSGLSKSTKKTLGELQDLMDPTGSYKNYRTALANASPPVLPFVYDHCTILRPLHPLSGLIFSLTLSLHTLTLSPHPYSGLIISLTQSCHYTALTPPPNRTGSCVVTYRVAAE